jgi:hypothetical protein
MKHILILGLVALMSHVALSQDKYKNDPSYSVNNYKHPNKAAYAKKNNLDASITVSSSTGKANDDYKHGFNKPKKAERSKVSVETRKNTKNKSYKHPYGF